MEDLKELWEDIEEGGKVEIVMGRIGSRMAVKRGDRLFWGEGDVEVDAYSASCHKWQLVEATEKVEMKTEKWMRYNNKEGFFITYRLDNHFARTPSYIMDCKNFLRFVGKIPKESKWPGHRWNVWVNEENLWNPHYWPERGYTKQIFADYAEMRVEK